MLKPIILSSGLSTLFIVTRIIFIHLNPTQVFKLMCFFAKDFLDPRIKVKPFFSSLIFDNYFNYTTIKCLLLCLILLINFLSKSHSMVDQLLTVFHIKGDVPFSLMSKWRKFLIYWKFIPNFVAEDINVSTLYEHFKYIQLNFINIIFNLNHATIYQVFSEPSSFNKVSISIVSL